MPRASHRLGATPEHNVWSMMKRRCLNPKDKRFSSYGGRGISVCQRWKDSFEWFLVDMGPRPSANLTLERRDNDGNYEPGNCHWGTDDEQRRNTRRNVFVTFGEKTQTIADWAKQLNLKFHTLRARIQEYGWPIEKALGTPNMGPFSATRQPPPGAGAAVRRANRTHWYTRACV